MSATEPIDVDDDEFDDYDDPPPPPPSAWRRMQLVPWFRAAAMLPAFVAILLTIAAAATPRGNIEGSYRTIVRDALEAEQYQRAFVGAERLLQCAPFNSEYRFWLALACEGKGDKRLADELMAALAPDDRAGFGLAHFWRADRLLRQEPLEMAAIQQAERHLRRVDGEQARSEPVMRRMALIMLKTNRLEEAKSFLAGVNLSASPDLRVAHAEALLQRGALEDGNRELTKAVDELREQVARQGRGVADGGRARRTLVEALGLQGAFVAAEQVLQEGIVSGPANLYARPAAQFYAKWISRAQSGAVGPPGRAAVAAAAQLLAENNDGTLASNGLLSFLYQQTGKLDDAVTLLSGLARTEPDAAFDLVRLYLRLGKRREATEAAKAAARLLESRLEQNPVDAGLRERLAEASLLIEDHRKAVAVVEEGRKRGDRPTYGPLLARAYVAWWEAVAAGTATADGPKLELLKRAIDADPWNPFVFSRLAAIKGPDAQAARAMVANLLARGEAPPAAIHWILGNEAWGRGDKSVARSHLEQAYALAPTNPLVLNNFAWMLAFGEPPDVARALRLAEEGVRAAPKALELRDTRGRIYAKSGEWSKALADLQLCLPTKKSDAEFMAVIIEAAEHAGLPDLADQFRRTSEEQRSLPAKSDKR